MFRKYAKALWFLFLTIASYAVLTYLLCHMSIKYLRYSDDLLLLSIVFSCIAPAPLCCYFATISRRAFSAAVNHNDPRPSASVAASHGQNYYRDELFPEAVEVVLETKCVSIPRLQTNLRIGSIRSGKLIDEMEEHGIIGPERGARPREIFYTLDRWIEEKDNFVPEAPPQPEPVPPNGRVFCPHCGRSISKNARYCCYCWKSVSTKSPSVIEFICSMLIVFGILRLFVPLSFSIIFGSGASSTSSKQVPDTVVYSDSDITLYASGIYYGGDQPTIKFMVENNAGENIGFYCSTFIVDDVMMDSILWIDVAADSKATGTLYLDDDVLNNAGFDHISYIEFYEPHISFKESNRDTKYISIDCSFQNVTPRDFDTSGDVLYSRNGVTVISRFEPGQSSRTIPLLIINESGRDINPWTSHVTVNGYTVTEWHSGAIIRNNAARYFDIQLVKESVEEAGVSSIYKASFNLSFLKAGSTQELFSAGQLYVK